MRYIRRIVSAAKSTVFSPLPKKSTLLELYGQVVMASSKASLSTEGKERKPMSSALTFDLESKCSVRYTLMPCFNVSSVYQLFNSACANSLALDHKSPREYPPPPPRISQTTDFHASCNPSIIKRPNTGPTCTDRVQTLLEQYISSGS